MTLFACAFSLLSLNGCKKDEDKASAKLSSVTTFPILTLLGDDIIGVAQGGVFTDPGYEAAVGSTNVTNQVTVTGAVNTAVVGFYTLTYTVKNEQNYSATATRRVWVGDVSNAITTDLSGDYTMTCVRTTATATVNRGPYQTTLTKLCDGNYYVEDFLGGYYWIGAAYGVAYAYEGVIKVASDGTVTLVYTNLGRGWGDGASLDFASYASNVITWGARMNDADTYLFTVTLTKN
ncbi:hypothetical protein FACS1894201_11770 [Bacteroidia bacterium]|nr:hypothetical protein FACS1894201_11770 [Bacteroidia bacterium]